MAIWEASNARVLYNGRRRKQKAKYDATRNQMEKQKLIIVYAEAYKELVEALVQKVNELGSTNAVMQTVAEYSTHKTPPSDECHLLFVGDGDENPYTAFYYPKIAFRLKNECGAYYGGDKTRAIICGDGDMSHRKQLKIVFDKQRKGEIDQSSPAAKNHIGFIPFALVAFSATFSLILPILTLGGMFLFGKVQKRKIRYLQVLLGMDRVLESITN